MGKSSAVFENSDGFPTVRGDLKNLETHRKWCGAIRFENHRSILLVFASQPGKEICRESVRDRDKESITQGLAKEGGQTGGEDGAGNDGAGCPELGIDNDIASVAHVSRFQPGKILLRETVCLDAPPIQRRGVELLFRWEAVFACDQLRRRNRRPLGVRDGKRHRPMHERRFQHETPPVARRLLLRWQLIRACARPEEQQ